MGDTERYDLWRRQGFICKPWSGDLSDGARFLGDYIEAAGSIDADDDAQHDDVLNGLDEGGDAAAALAIPAGAGGNAARAARRGRLKKVSAKFLDHASPNDTVRSTLRAAGDARAQFLYFQNNLCESMQRGDVLEIKARLTQATILGAVGFKIDSVNAFKMWIDKENERISPATARLNETEQCEAKARL